MVQLPWRTLWRFLKKLKLLLPYDPAVPFLGAYPKELKAESQGDLLTAAFFTRAKRRSNPSDHQWLNGKNRTHRTMIQP